MPSGWRLSKEPLQASALMLKKPDKPENLQPPFASEQSDLNVLSQPGWVHVIHWVTGFKLKCFNCCWAFFLQRGVRMHSAKLGQKPIRKRSQDTWECCSAPSEVAFDWATILLASPLAPWEGGLSCWCPPRQGLCCGDVKKALRSAAPSVAPEFTEVVWGLLGEVQSLPPTFASSSPPSLQCGTAAAPEPPASPSASWSRWCWSRRPSWPAEPPARQGNRRGSLVSF